MNEKMRVSLSEILPIIEEQLALGKEVYFSPKGTSMLPVLMPDRDSVILKAPPKKIKKYDLPLYKRENGQFVMHRIVKKSKDGTLTMCGDNQFEREKNIKPQQIIGIVSALYRNGRLIKSSSPIYHLYCVFIVNTQPIRRFAHRLKASIKHTKSKDDSNANQTNRV